jgi:hypothetical protein
LFGICDGIGTVCGALVPHALPTLPDLGLYAICVIVVALAARRSAWWLWLMPVLLGIDNLSLGASIGMAPASAIASAAIALSGMTASTGVLSVLRAWWNLRIPTTCVGGRRR